MTSKGAGLAELRKEFPAHHISKLPKETRAQIDARKTDRNVMVFNCEVCGGHHHKNAVHLDYVGHAALTDRLLDTDIEWSWEPVAFNADGLPAFDRNNGLWIKLTVCGVTRLGYGSADGKAGGDAVKEIIGDALRNAAMRFGAALDLWHKGDLHLGQEDDDGNAASKPAPKEEVALIDETQRTELQALIEATASDIVSFCKFYKIGSLPELPVSKFAHAQKSLKNKLAPRGEVA